jgi:cytoskeleton protein RodZ
VTLDDVSVSTKISVRFLDAIETEQFDKLPGGIFNKGFVRAYAQHLGIDADQAVADYLNAAGLLPHVPLNTMPPGELDSKIDELPIPAVDGAPAKISEKGKFTESARLIEPKSLDAKPEPQKIQEAKPPEAKPVVVKPVEQKVVAKPAPEMRPPQQTRTVVADDRASKHKGKKAKARTESQQQKPQAEKKKEPKPVTQPLPEPANGNGMPWGKVAFALLVIAFGLAVWGSFQREPEKHTMQPAPQAVPEQTQTIAPAGTVENVSQRSEIPSETAPQAQPAEPAAASFLVVVQAHEDSWVSIVADGKEIMQEVMDAPAERAVEAHKEVVVKAANIGALDFVFNGKKLPSQGHYDEVKTLTFDPNGLQSQPVKTAGL